MFIIDQGITTVAQHGTDRFGVALVHLAAVGFDMHPVHKRWETIERRHYRSMSKTVFEWSFPFRKGFGEKGTNPRLVSLAGFAKP